MSDFTIIENNYESKEKFGFNYGCEHYALDKKDIQALLDGKALAATINGDEYSLFIELDKEEDPNDQN